MFDPRILHFKIDFLENNHNEPYPIPAHVTTSVVPFAVMQKFVEAHGYTP